MSYPRSEVQQMFGIKRRIRLGQFRRAVTIENMLKAGMFDHEVRRRGYPTDPDQPVHAGATRLAAALNYMFTGGISADKERDLLEAGIEPASVVGMAQEIFELDRKFERLVARTLYELVSLGMVLKKEPMVEQVLGSRPNLLDFTAQFRRKYPELFGDVTEAQYRDLVVEFAKEYLPEMEAQASALF